MINIRKLESELWESADLLRAGSKLTSNQYCMPVLGLLFLRYAYSRFKMVEVEILKQQQVPLMLELHYRHRKLHLPMTGPVPQQVLLQVTDHMHLWLF